MLSQIGIDVPRLAFSHTLHYEIGIFEIQMTLLFHPRNSHCIYVDQKADPKISQAVLGIVNCYQEIFLQVSNLFKRKVLLYEMGGITKF